MDSELIEFISHLDDDVPFSPYPQLNEMWRELEVYFDRSYFDIDEYLEELLPSPQPVSSTMKCDIPTIEEPQLMTEEKLFRSFAIPETFFNDLIVDAPVVKHQNIVPIEILLNSVRSRNFSYTGRKYEHPFKVFVSTRVTPAATIRNDSPAAPIRNDYIPNTEPALDSSISSNMEWFSILHKQTLHPGMTAEAMARNILHDKSLILPPRTEIVKVIQILFMDLNSYIDRLSTEFGDHKFFDTPQFNEIAVNMQEKTLSQSNIKAKPLRDVLLFWMEMVTASFARINEQRYEIEVKVSEQIINEAVRIYRGRLMSLNGDKTSISYKKESDLICQGIRHSYANCGETFTARIVSQLEKRLKNESLTADEPRITSNNSTDSDDFQVIIDLLVSEYNRNINQKGIQCAGISTLKQFDDVNARCLKDIWHSFDRKMDGVPFDQRNELQEQLKSKLDFESNCKRAAFKESSVPSVVPSVSAKSHSIGIHFGFESLSISFFDGVTNCFRSLYGPVANGVSFTHDGISIGLIPSDVSCLNMENLLTNLNVDRLYDTGESYGKLKIESIIALMLMYIDEMAKQSLHTTSKIQYAIAIPSCLNDVMQGIFKTAIDMADINCRLIREQCALTTNLVREHHQAMTKNNDEFIVAMIVNEKNSCDSVVYGITGEERPSRMIKGLTASGTDDKRKLLGFVGDTGAGHELDKIKSKCNRRNRFIVCCRDQEICKRIKTQFNKSKVHPVKFDSNLLAQGAALLSHVANGGSSSLLHSFNLRNLTSIKPSDASYRLVHKTNNSNAQDLQVLSVELRSIIDYHLRVVSESKAAAKQIIVGKMKDLEESHLREQDKEKFRQSLKNDLKAVDEELFNKRVVERIAAKWKKNQF